MRRKLMFAVFSTCVGVMVAATATTEVAAGHEGEDGKTEVVIRDECDPRDPAWDQTGGCSLRQGTVTVAEFNTLRLSPLAPSLIGHPAWWFDPNYLQVEAGKRLKVRNDGGRTHTFTEVANFGGGRVPPLNASQMNIPPLVAAPECVAPGVVDIQGGGRDVVDGLTPGDHKFQCCIHPWMRTMVKVKNDDRH